MNVLNYFNEILGREADGRILYQFEGGLKFVDLEFYAAKCQKIRFQIAPKQNFV